MSLTRRALLQATPSVLAIAALPAAAQASQTSPLGDLIEAHRRAYALLDEAVGAQMEAQAVATALPAVYAPGVVYPDGTAAEMYDLSVYSEDQVRQFTSSRHAELRRIHCGTWAERMSGGYVSTLREEIDASEKRAVALLDKAIAGFNELQRQADIPEADRLYQEAQAVEIQARLDLVLYRPRDKAEAQAKAAYLAEANAFADGWCCDDDFVEALLQTMGEVA